MKSKYLATTLAILAAGSALAENIALTDPSHEAAFGGTNGTVVSGWFTFGGAVGGNLVTPGSFWNFSNPDGTNAAYATNFGENDGGSIYQTVELDAGVTYSMTVAIGMSSTVSKSDGKFALVFFNQNFGSLLAQTTGVISTRGSFADYSVQFTPTTTGIYQVGMRNRGYVPGTGADNNQSTIFFDNIRLAVGGSLVYPESIDVSSTDAATVQPIDVDIDNGSGGALDITGIQVTGTDSGRFTVITSASPGTPFTIANGATGTVQISFDPGGIGGAVSASLEITSNDPNSPVSIPISGIIRDPYISSVASVNLPATTVDASSNFDVTIDNLGTADLSVDGAFITGSDASFFDVVTDFTNPLVIPGGGSTVVTFSFDPQGETRTFSANLEFDSDDPAEATRIIPVTAELLKPFPPALSLRLDGNSASSGGVGTGVLPIVGAPFPNEVIDNSRVPDSSSARNFYYDSDGDLAFTSPGDTSGNTNASLEVDVIVTGTQVLNFYVDADGTNFIPDNFAANAYRMTGLDITLSDGTSIPLNVTQGTPQTFSDPGGETWTVALNGVGPLAGETTDIVGNIDSAPDGQGPDYHFTLTFTYGSADDFSSWAGGFGIPNDVNDDSDSDGIVALIEYGLGYNPTVAETLPQLVPAGADFTLTWPKGAQAAADAAITYTVEVSDNLATWDDPEPADLAESGTEIVLTIQGGSRKFARLIVTQTP